MTVPNGLQAKASETIKSLDDAGLITAEHALTIELIQTLCAAIPDAASGAMVAALSKEIRACLESLPKPVPVLTDELEDLLADIASD